jgi:hypothetical protein
MFEKEKCILLAKEYKSNKTPMPYICQCGRESKVCLSGFLRGDRCFECGKDKHRKPDSRLNYTLKRKYTTALRVTLYSTGQRKTTKSRELLGYGIAELKERITNHPNWEAVKNDNWQLDHIFPIKAFIEYEISDLKVINALDNLQPLTAFENMSKHDTYDKIQFETWLQSKGLILY